MTTDALTEPAVVPIRALAHDGDTAFVVERASDPPTTAAHRFRVASAPVAARVAEQVRIARDLIAAPALSADARAAVGNGLQHVVIELRELAESFDVSAVAEVCRAREAAAALLDPRAVAGIEHVAHGLLGDAAVNAPAATTPGSPVPPTAVAMVPATSPEPAEPTPADVVQPDAPTPDAPEPEAPEPDAPAPAFRPPTGPALVELLEHGITGIERWPGTPLDMPAVPAPDGVVAIEALLYRGRAALDRARAVRDVIRVSSVPDPELLAELYDLLDLAASD